MRSFTAFALELAASMVAPPRCAACDESVAMATAFCAACASTVERQDGRALGEAASDDRGISAFAYGGAIARAITRLKYEGRPDLARPLGDLLASCVAAQPGLAAFEGRPPLVVPVPLHPLRLSERGFNQAALVAARVAKRLRAPFAARFLVRCRDTAQQTRLDRHERARNVAAAFAVRDSHAIGPRAVLVVDDVRTTGATLGACAAALRAGGAPRVLWATIACTE